MMKQGTMRAAMTTVRPTALFAVVSCILALPAQSSVSVVDSDRTITLANGSVSLRIEKATGQINELLHAGHSMLSPGQKGYVTTLGRFIDDSDTTYTNVKETKVRSKFLRARDCAFKTHVSTPEMVGVSFTPRRPADFPFDMEYHYVLREGESGFCFYVVARKPGDRPDALLTQLRFGMRVAESMRHIRLSDERSGLLPASKDIANAKGKVMDATYVLPSGEIVTKYSWASPTEDVPVHGLHDDTRGVWIITGGNEYLNGGPTKQHNTSHGTYKGPILLKLFYSNHYGSRGSFVSGEWKKVFGPIFVYMNSGDGPQALWADAKRQRQQHGKAWPYHWLQHAEYPVERATVTGRFHATGAADLSRGWVVLARPKEHRGLDWQQQGADTYIYRARMEANGEFAIPAVRKGSYTLYAFASGVAGEFRKDDISVNSADTIDLGDLQWSERSFGQPLWRIGVPDRSAAEFRHGDDFHRWGVWFDYPREFPNDVDFVVGESRERTDWNYAHMAVWEEEVGWHPRMIPDDRKGEGSWRLPTWKVRFRCNESMQGRATLTIALASVSHDGGLAVELNGKPLATFVGMEGDSALPRSGIRGIFRERFAIFDASLLRRGENVLTLDLLPSKMHTGKRSNYPHFGVMYDFHQLDVNHSRHAAPRPDGKRE